MKNKIKRLSHTEVRTPSPPDRSESLYRQRFAGQIVISNIKKHAAEKLRRVHLHILTLIQCLFNSSATSSNNVASNNKITE